MRLRTFYGLAILFPVVGLGIAAVLYPQGSHLAAGLGPGGTAHWLYPTSAIRGLLAYAIVGLWLVRALYGRPLSDFEPLLWRAPLANVAANIAVLVPLILIHGRAAEFLSEQGWLAALRLVIRLLVGVGYVGLVVFTRKRIWPRGALETQEQAGA